MIKEEFKITGMSCSHCIKSVEKAVKDLPIEKFEVTMGILCVEYDTDKISKEQIVNAIEGNGYGVINSN